MPTTANDWIEDTLGHLHSGNREEINLLSTALTDTTTTSVVMSDDLKSIKEGAVICIDLELMYVRSVVVATKTATVIRGFGGSTAATHSANAIIQVNPKFSRYRVFNALNDELRAISGEGIYRMQNITLTFNSDTAGYDFTGVTAADVIDIYEMRWETDGTSKLWPEVKNYELLRNLASGEFASTLAVMVYDPVTNGNDIRVTYRSRLGTLSAAADVLTTTTGLHPEALDIPPIGAAWRLAQTREVKRNFSEAQGEPRRSGEVPPGANLRAASGLYALRQKRIGDERRRLMALYPPKHL